MSVFLCNSKFKPLLLFSFFSLVHLITCPSANAAIITFDDRDTFILATGATSATGALPDLGEVIPPTTIGTLTFSLGPSATRLFVGTSGVGPVPPTPVGNDWTTRLAGNEIAITGRENLNVDISNLVFSFGFDFVEPENDPNVGGFIDSIFSVTLLDSGSFVDSFLFNAPNDTAAFVGVFSNTAFNQVEILEISGGAENEFFGEFFTGTTAVPEPSSFTMISLACLIMSIGWLKKKLGRATLSTADSL